MITAEIKYTRNLRTQATHSKSGVQIISDAPVDNNGKGQAFSPTDLLATSLVSCMMTIMGIAAEKRSIKLDHMKATMIKIMASDPRRVKVIEIEMEIQENWTDQEKKLLENAALNCPVAKSLNSEIEQRVVFNYI